MTRRLCLHTLILSASVFVAACGATESNPTVEAGAQCSVEAPPAPDGGGVCCPTGPLANGASGQCGGDLGGWSPTASGCCDPIHGSHPDEPLKPAIDGHGCVFLLLAHDGFCPGLDASVDGGVD